MTTDPKFPSPDTVGRLEAHIVILNALCKDEAADWAIAKRQHAKDLRSIISTLTAAQARNEAAQNIATIVDAYLENIQLTAQQSSQCDPVQGLEHIFDIASDLRALLSKPEGA